MGRIQTLFWECVFILYNKSLASRFSTLLLWERLYPELLKGSTGSFYYVHKFATQNCIDACCHTCFYTHINTHYPLCWPMRPEAGWVLQILFVYFGFLPCCCQSLVFIQSLRCLLRVYPVSSGFYTALTLFLNWLLCCCFFRLCACAGPKQTPVPAGRHPDTWRLPGEAAAEQPALRPAAEPALPQSITGETEGEKAGRGRDCNDKTEEDN